jgi:hypothetical protein
MLLRYKPLYSDFESGPWVRFFLFGFLGGCHMDGQGRRAYPKGPQYNEPLRLLRNSTKIAAQFYGLEQCSQKTPNGFTALSVA